MLPGRLRAAVVGRVVSVTEQRARLGCMVVLADEPHSTLQRVGKVTGTSTTGRRHVTWESGDAGYLERSELRVVGHVDDPEWEWWDE